MSDTSAHPSTPDPVFDLQRFFDWDPWRARAACRGLDPDLFFPPSSVVTTGRKEISPRTAKLVAAAVEVCRDCPVRVECATYALNRREEHGIWGGLDEADRRRLLRSQVSA